MAVDESLDCPSPPLGNMTATPDLSGLRANVFTGTLSPFARNPLETLTRAAEEQGPIATLRFGNANAFLVSDAAMVEELLVRRGLDFIKAGPVRDQRRLFGNGLLINEGEAWARQRSLVQPAFHPGNLAAYVPVVVARTKQMLEGWHGKETCNVSEELQNLLMGIAAESIFGAEVAPKAAEIGAALESAMDHYSSRRGTARFIPDWLPLGDSRKYLNGVRDLLSLVERTIVRRKTVPSSRSDLLEMLLAARDESGMRMSAGQVRDEAINLFVGGFDTQSTALSWTWYLLSRHSHIAQRVCNEVDVMLHGRAPTAADFPKLAFTQKVLTEAMRLYPPAWIIGREAITDTEIGGMPIPKGTLVVTSQWVMHRSAKYFANPLEFIPQRWESDQELPRFAYFPFGEGPRVCIGAALASLDCTLVLAMIAQRYRFALESGGTVQPRAGLTLRPASSIHARLFTR